MSDKISFWWICIKRAASGASAFANSWQWVFGTPTLAGIIWLGNSWLGDDVFVPSQNVTGALLSAALAFFITWLVKFFFGLVFAPAELFFEKKSQNDALRSEITNLLNSDAAIEQLSKFYHEGKLKYQEYDNFSDWKLKMKEWTQEVEKFISANFSVSELHEFRKSGSGFEYKTEWNWVDIEHNKAWAAKASAWRRIQALDDMVRGSSYAYMPHKNRLKELLGETRE